MILPEPNNPDERRLRLPDGRRLSLLEVGLPGGRPVIGLHGTPGSRLKFRGAHRAAVELGIRLIAPDRWGYGSSEAPPRPALEDYPADLAFLADALDLGRFAVLGISGGGPFAAMAAGRLASRVTRTALVCPVGPLGPPPGVEPLAGLFHRFCFRALPRVPGAVRAAFAAYRLLVLAAPDLAVRLAAARAPGADRALLADPVMRGALAATFACGLAGSSRGPAIDMALFSRDWRPHPATPGTASVWLGTHDQNVPLGAALHLASLLGADVAVVESAGHYWIAHAWREVLGWLAPDVSEPERPA